MAAKAVWAAGVAVLVTATAGPPATAAGTSPENIRTAPAAQPHRTGAGAATPSATVTLITGDRVVLGSDGGVIRLIRAKGREDVPFSVQRRAGHTHVVPQDAQRMISEGTLDRRLFDVTQLVKDKYDDAHRDSLPLIVGYRQPAPGSPAPHASGGGVLDSLGGTARQRRPLPAIGGEAFSAAKSGTAHLWSAVTTPRTAGPGNGPGKQPFAATAPAVAHIWLDGKVYPTLDKSTAQIGAPAAIKAGYTGKGVKIAILDTGVDQAHPDLKGVEIAEKNFTSYPDAKDRYGHGTHVASIAAGSGAKSAGKYKGVAPDARIIDAKVLGDDGPGEESWILEGMQWAVDQGADIVNMSLGAPEPDYRPMDEAVARLSGKALFVVSAGNHGSNAKTLTSPAGAPQALTVGNVDKQDVLSEDSSRGPSVAGNVKPDLTAPGTDITAARSTALSDGPGNGYMSYSGTSMAAPHAAGAAAMLMQQHPAWTGQQVKQALTASTKPNPALHAYQQGSGRLDVARAITANVVSEPGSLGFGTQAWPHGDDKPVTKTLTYRNHGTKPVTLTLSAATVDEQGRPAPAGMFKLKDTKLTVPAGGTAQTSVTADTKAGTADGTFGGTILASGDGQAVRTGLVVVREVESYDLTLKHLDTKGEAASYYTTAVSDPAAGIRHEVKLTADSTAVLRLPKGTYAVESSVYGTVGDIYSFVQPVVNLTKNTTIALDARVAKPVAVSPPDPAARLTGFTMGYEAPSVGLSGTVHGTPETILRTAHLGPAGPDLKAQFSGVWQAPKDTQYRLAFNSRGSWFTGLAPRVTKAETAEVKIGIAASVTGAKGTLTGIPLDQDGFSIGTPEPTPVSPLPRTTTQYVNTAGLRWIWSTQQLNAAGEPRISHTTTPKTHTAGKSSTQRFNTGVAGPDLAADPEQGATRYGNSINASMKLFNDGWGHSGDSATTAGSSRLDRNGVKVGEGPVGWLTADVPAASAAYRLTMTATRSTKDTATSTKVSAAWTFTSAQAPEDRPAALPLSTVRLSPFLSPSSTAKAGATLTVPLVLAGPAAEPGALASLTVKASYDNGATWTPLPVTTDATGARSVSPAHPATAKAVSFQVDLKDKAGNTTSETITNAYLLAP
ncbi:S8 family serine peptidase [Streptomyces sp. NPDC002054]|uniref:S8 family serine peptidase n=1 Tax=Streptomyces sp. NPDC002054 TaxID=3154663 RepID=UPI00331B8252